MQTAVVNVLAMDDRMTHLSRLGARTLCGKLAKFETKTRGKPCQICAERAARKQPG